MEWNLPFRESFGAKCLSIVGMNVCLGLLLSKTLNKPAVSLFEMHQIMTKYYGIHHKITNPQAGNNNNNNNNNNNFFFFFK